MIADTWTSGMPLFNRLVANDARKRWWFQSVKPIAAAACFTTWSLYFSPWIESEVFSGIGC